MKKVFKNKGFIITGLIYSAALSAALSYFIVPWMFGNVDLSNFQTNILYASIAVALMSPAVLIVIVKNGMKHPNDNPVPKFSVKGIFERQAMLSGIVVATLTLFILRVFKEVSWSFLQELVAIGSYCIGAGLLAGMGENWIRSRFKKRLKRA